MDEKLRQLDAGFVQALDKVSASLTILATVQLAKCSDSWDHVPIRSWPLFKARRVLRTLLTTDKPLLNS